MPVSIRKTAKGGYRVSTPHGVKAKNTTRKKADAQARLLRAVDHGWKPTGESITKLQGSQLACQVLRLHEAISGALWQYGDPNSRALAQYLRRSGRTREDVSAALELVANILRVNFGSTGLIGDSYAYYPANPNLTAWEATDGDFFEASLLEIMLEYAGVPAMGESAMMDAAIQSSAAGPGSPDFAEFMASRRQDQEDFELSQM